MVATYIDGSQKLYINGEQVPYGGGMSIIYAPWLPAECIGRTRYESMTLEGLPSDYFPIDSTSVVTSVQVLEDSPKKYRCRIGHFPRVVSFWENGNYVLRCLQDESGSYGRYTDVEVSFEEFYWY